MHRCLYRPLESATSLGRYTTEPIDTDSASKAESAHQKFLISMGEAGKRSRNYSLVYTCL